MKANSSLVEYVLAPSLVGFSCKGCVMHDGCGCTDGDADISDIDCSAGVIAVVPAGFSDQGPEPSKPEDFQPVNRLWAIHIPGPDEIHAAPSESVARHMAEKHNAAMTAYFERHPDPDCLGPSKLSCMAVVVQYPWAAADHAEALADFSYAQWGLSDSEGGEHD